MRKQDAVEKIDIIAGQLLDLGRDLGNTYADPLRKNLVDHILESASALTEIYAEFCDIENIESLHA